ncbi:MAG: lytic murein transglycosylase [Candidatus Sungbacteria bacterium]|nr:lytic murein transglycosylase [Candidatus Sungbacteria bacterium]
MFVFFALALLLVRGNGAMGQIQAVPNTNLSPEERSSLEQQLEALEREAMSLDKNIQQVQSEARTLKNEIQLLNDQIKRRELEIKRLDLVIRQTETDIRRKVASITKTEKEIGVSQVELAASVREFARADSDTLLEVMLKNGNLSDFFLALNNLENMQKSIQGTLGGLRDYKVALEEQKTELEEFREGQSSAKAIQEVDRRALAQKKAERDNLLKVTQGKESAFQALLKEKKNVIAELKGKLFYLERTGISPEEALRYAKLAAERTGIRTAFLLALLEVETGRQFENGQLTVGSNVGTGNWRRDMYDCYIRLGKPRTAEAQKKAFFQIASALGADPDTLPVSRMPNYGCGGAMGPAQFIPTTWLTFDEKVVRATGKSLANPWNVEDAFTASALFLSEAGGRSKTKSGEIAAARTYISGRPNCPTAGSARIACISYANRVYSLSQEIERAL